MLLLLPEAGGQGLVGSASEEEEVQETKINPS